MDSVVVGRETFLLITQKMCRDVFALHLIGDYNRVAQSDCILVTFGDYSLRLSFAPARMRPSNFRVLLLFFTFQPRADHALLRLRTDNDDRSSAT